MCWTATNGATTLKTSCGELSVGKADIEEILHLQAQMWQRGRQRYEIGDTQLCLLRPREQLHSPSVWVDRPDGGSSVLQIKRSLAGNVPLPV